jgi:arylsulfatase A-like enzyme
VRYWTVLPIALLAACGDTTAPAGDRRPDVVVVLLDTLRADALSFYGAEREVAPFLASLAREGTLFERAWSTSTWTAPATASVLTGCYPDRHGVTRGFLAHFREADDGQVAVDDVEQLELHSLSRGTPTLAERFKRLGYTTLGLTANINIGDEMEFDRGFDRFERHHGETAKELRERLETWQADLTGDEPVFLYLHFNDVHEPYHLRPRFFESPPDAGDEVARAYAQYLSEVGYVDSFLGRLFGELGWAEDTLLAVVADHGEEFMDHGQMAHEFTLFRELSQVPMLVFGPTLGVRPGHVAENVSVIDLAPTLLDLVGAPGEAWDGRSLASRCRQQDKRPPEAERVAWAERPLFLHRFERGRNLWGVVFEHWKLIQDDDGLLALFDLETDPTEQVNLAGRQPERCERLLALLDTHRARAVTTESRRADVTIDREMLERLKTLGYVK